MLTTNFIMLKKKVHNGLMKRDVGRIKNDDIRCERERDVFEILRKQSISIEHLNVNFESNHILEIWEWSER